MATYYVAKLADNASGMFTSQATIEADSTRAARKAMEGLPDLPDGRYLLLADTSGPISKTAETVTKTKLTLEAPPRTRTRKPKPEEAPKQKAVKK